MKKHRILCAVLALLVLTVPACGKKKTPLDYGMKIAAKLDKMMEKDNGKKFIAEELNDLIKHHAAGDYTDYDTVYRVTFEEDKLYEYLEIGSMDQWPELKPSMQYSAISAVLDTINSMYVPASSLLVRFFKEETSVEIPEIEESCIYLYTFQNGSPVAVVFVPFAEDSVTVSGQFIAADESADIHSGVLEEWFAAFSPTVEIIAGT